ncbi:MAG: 2-C-methyl-D-erythritol 4-phosphate cytidylyltransferase [Proteobacteria bacterium]|nr:2-C-methyl-D-erythritol 4-phosphate cytidylyltransferase [Pseudomonadota bacterium]HQR02701.1 2-C-methyl-D-erythritol 4-phosphate cytidylyltransferase [Rhodocyclaceae bacterium]
MACYALIPAAGVGARMGGIQPKQYLSLLGHPLIHHAIAAFCAVSGIERVFVVLSPEDAFWDEHDWSSHSSRLAVLRCGGATRAASVANGLRAITGQVGASDWILVHDAARACIASPQIENLIARLEDDPVGGLLAVPVADTLKRAGEDDRVEATIPRTSLWQAQTPQMFRHGQLLHALEQSPDSVTDEASAIEALGFAPRLIAADMTNLKITYPADLQLAEWILRNRRI